jgi:hypothetical protein
VALIRRETGQAGYSWVLPLPKLHYLCEHGTTSSRLLLGGIQKHTVLHSPVGNGVRERTEARMLNEDKQSWMKAF